VRVPRHDTGRHAIGKPVISLLLRWPNLREHAVTMFAEVAPLDRTDDMAVAYDEHMAVGVGDLERSVRGSVDHLGHWHAIGMPLVVVASMPHRPPSPRRTGGRLLERGVRQSSPTDSGLNRHCTRRHAWRCVLSGCPGTTLAQ